jgi:hypothetical protein
VRNFCPLSTNWVPGWRPFHTILLVFSSQAKFQLTATLSTELLHSPTSYFTSLYSTELLTAPANNCFVKSKSKSKLCYDRRFSRPVCLGIKHPSRAYDQSFITVRHLRVCCCGALSLTRGRVCRFCFSVLFITCRHGPRRKRHSSIVVLVSIATETCLPSRRLGTGFINPSVYCCVRVSCERYLATTALCRITA